MSRSPTHLAERLVWQYYHRGAEGRYTKRFSSFDADIQSQLRRLAEVGEEEAPAIAAYANDPDWVLLTSQRLAWLQGGSKRQIPLIEIDGVEYEKMDAFRAKMPHLERLHNMPLPRLTIVTKAGKLDFACETGGPFFGFLNVLLMIVRMNHPLDGGY